MISEKTKPFEAYNYLAQFDSKKAESTQNNIQHKQYRSVQTVWCVCRTKTDDILAKLGVIGNAYASERMGYRANCAQERASVCTCICVDSQLFGGSSTCE